MPLKNIKLVINNRGRISDLDLTITTEMVATETPSSIKEYITREQEWKSKNIVANLPTDFDADFWGNANIISPTAEINKIITTIGKRNNEVDTREIPGDWKYFKQDFFIAYGSNDSITLIPIMKGSWKDDQSVACFTSLYTVIFLLRLNYPLQKK